MDKIWDRKSFEVGGHWPLWRGWKKTNGHAEPTKVKRIFFLKLKADVQRKVIKVLEVRLREFGSLSIILILKQDKF